VSVRVKDYEIVYVIRPDLSEEDRGNKQNRIKGLVVENGGEIVETTDWGKRTLAYEIRHHTEGYYGYMTFRLPSTAVEPVKGRLNIDEELLRYEIVLREA
jgi:small subunit ribosomal protein S6